jgi:SM-20-related protein
VGFVEFQINPDNDVEEFGAYFRAHRRLHISEFLERHCSEALYHHLKEDVTWSSFLSINRRRYEAAAEVQRTYRSRQRRQLANLAYSTARQGDYAYFHDGSAVISPDCSNGSSLLARLAKFLNSGTFKDFIRRVSGIEEVAFVDARALRFCAGHFMTYGHEQISADANAKCRLLYYYNLTPSWRPEWGGLLEFRGNKGYIVEAQLPCFNCLDLFPWSQGHWISFVSPFADGENYSVSGGIYEST